VVKEGVKEWLEKVVPTERLQVISETLDQSLEEAGSVA